MKELRNGCPSTVPATFTSPRVPKYSADPGITTYVHPPFDGLFCIVAVNRRLSLLIGPLVDALASGNDEARGDDSSVSTCSAVVMTAERRRLARTVLGVPTVPPPRAAAIVNDVRAALSRTRVALAPPPVRIVEAALSSLDQAAVVALCELDVPDALTRPMSVAVLAAQLGVDRDQLERLLRFGATRGWVRFDRRGRVRRTRALAFLTREHLGGWRAWIEFASRDEVVGATAALAPAIRSGAEAFMVANGSSFFEWMAANRDASAA